MTLITIQTVTHNMRLCVCVCVHVSVCQNHLFIYFFISVRFHSILLQCCWWDWCLFSDGPIITGLMALEHCSDFTGWQTTLNMNQGDFSMPGTPRLQQAIHLGVCKTQFRGSSAESIPHARSFLGTCFFYEQESSSKNAQHARFVYCVCN